jgi:GcrA cell cycle regulator
MELLLDGSERLTMQSGDWTPEHSQALREHVMRGISFARAAAEINARFGIAYTRNAAIGRGKRIGLVGPVRRDDRPTAAKPSAPRKVKSRESQAAKPRRPEPDTVPAAPAASVQLRCVGMPPRLISFVELEPGDCRYPYGGDKDDEPIAFCSHPRRAGSCYCTPHFHLTRGVGTAAERAVGPVMLRLVEAA